MRPEEGFEEAQMRLVWPSGWFLFGMIGYALAGLFTEGPTVVTHG